MPAHLKIKWWWWEDHARQNLKFKASLRFALGTCFRQTKAEEGEEGGHHPCPLAWPGASLQTIQRSFVYIFAENQ